MAKQLDNIDFLLDSINLDEFRMQCDMWGIDFIEAVQTFAAYQHSPSEICIVLDHLYWIDQNGKEIDAPHKIDGPFSCAHSSITSLKGSPREIRGSFYCNNSHLKTLDGAPAYVDGEFNCSNTEITTLKGAPQEVGRDFVCAMNSELVSLEGGPREVGGCFDCEHTAISSLDGAPSYIGASLYCRVGTHVSKQQAEEYIRNFHCSSYEAIEWKKAHIDSTGHYREIKQEKDDENRKHFESK